MSEGTLKKKEIALRNQPQSAASYVAQRQQNRQTRALALTDNRQASIVQQQNKESFENSTPIQKEASSESGQKENNTGLPDTLKSGIENLSGYSMDDVNVHYNSDKPAQLNAHAYAQGSDIHLASGQEKHLSHEAWHVVQQKQGRVQPTLQMKEKVNVNDDEALEEEADVMGTKAETLTSGSGVFALKNMQLNSATVQGAFWHIEPGGKVSEGHRADVERLQSNDQFSGADDVKGLDNIDVSLNRRDITSAASGVGQGNEDLYVMAHGSQTGAGDGDQPWIGGMEFNDFAEQLTNRYGGTIQGQTIWLMTCLVGGVLDQMATALSTEGLRDVTIMAPKSFMFVSDAGIPHVHEDDDGDYQSLDRDVAKNNANFFNMSIADPKWMETGLGWAGYEIDDQGTCQAIDDNEVIKMVLEKFDLEGEEWSEDGYDYQGVWELWENQDDDDDDDTDDEIAVDDKEDKIDALKQKAEADSKELWEAHAFTIQDGVEYEDRLDKIVKETETAINNAEGGGVDIAYREGIRKLNELNDEVE